MIRGKSKDLIVVAPAFNSSNYQEICKWLAGRDNDLKVILDTHGYPPMWTRENNFESLVHIILEQQVSLASALAALNKLKEKLGYITPESILGLTDEEMRACFVSRQKMGYIRGLAVSIKNKEIDLEAFAVMPDEEVRNSLVAFKGIGNWTVDVYLMFSLQRADIFPVGDLAAVNALKRLKRLDLSTTKEAILSITETWKPFRTVASMMLWHYYLSNTRKKSMPV
ncbi:DNA-3-methyladenine glycosylase [Niabella yanshanensis]|uniref:DNA-3-methyladenine glycosylase II n=1 Tax=Niabella yanshanensis TaxID=577386 RepID=A0ABZ0W4F0_9BACT|nr:DNA-3-methyladenine glycosylase [Niabella yanshanensis]WQD37824.1 DNA-3-methyladenine glycosylase [Niabella yanshanensis]